MQLETLVAKILGTLSMKTLLLIVILVLIFGPLRRPLLRHIRFLLPAITGAVLGLGLGGYIIAKSGVQGPITILLPLTLAGGLAVTLGEGVKSWSDRVFGRKEQKRD